MDNLKEIRWQQRFQNFENSYKLLDKYASQIDFTELERAGLIQFFETTFELTWKVLKDYLESEGYQINSPREAIKIAFEINMISNGELWLEALVDRNLTVHTYDEEKSIEMSTKIVEKYAPMITPVYELLRQKLIEVREIK